MNVRCGGVGSWVLTSDKNVGHGSRGQEFGGVVAVKFVCVWGGGVGGGKREAGC